MDIEYEATFPNINKTETRQRLRQAGAVLVRSEFKQSRIIFDLPAGHEIANGWLRVRDEGDKITMSLKVVDGQTIIDQKEICLQVDSFEQAVSLLEKLGCQQKSKQESKRELWKIDKVEITIDEWPYLEPLVEIEGRDENSVRAVAKKMGFEYSQAKFCAIGRLYEEKYQLPVDYINNLPNILFNMPKNPFVRNQE